MLSMITPLGPCAGACRAPARTRLGPAVIQAVPFQAVPGNR